MRSLYPVLNRSFQFIKRIKSLIQLNEVKINANPSILRMSKAVWVYNQTGTILSIVLLSIFVGGCSKNGLIEENFSADATVISNAPANSVFHANAREHNYTMTLQSSHVTDYVRDGSKSMQVGNHFYSLGGWTAVPEESYNDIYRSKGDLSTWKKLPNAPWHGRHTFGIAKITSILYIFGGDYLHNVFDVWLSPDGIIWKRIATNKAFLGKNISGSVVSFHGKIWVIGGGYYDHFDPSIRWTNHIYSSPNGKNWTRQPDAPWAGRQYTDVCVWDNKLWMVGGNNGTNLADIWYMEKDGTWVQFEVPAEYVGRHATAVGVYRNKLVITCGNYHNDCWVIEKGVNVN